MSLVRGCVLCLVALLGCSDGTGLPDNPPVDAPPATGHFTVAWSIFNGPQEVTCEAAGAVIVSVEVTGPKLGAGYVEAFTCGNKMGTSRTLLAGTYDLAFELIGSSGSLGTLASQRVIVPADGSVAAMPLVFPVTAVRR